MKVIAMTQGYRAGKIIPLILAGGSGTRLAPLSTPDFPKQFLPLLRDTSPFQSVLERTYDRNNFSSPVIVCGENHVNHIHEQMSDMSVGYIITEPMGKNTAPAIALGIMGLNDDDVVLICPADHHIPDGEVFRRDVLSAMTLAEVGYIVTFGIHPTHAHTGYGYMCAGQKCGEGFQVNHFAEKPNKTTAESYCASGGYFWNAGIFLARVDVLRCEFQMYVPDMVSSVTATWNNRKEKSSPIFFDKDYFERIPKISFDYAVMEKTDKAVLLVAHFAWSDLGDFESINYEKQNIFDKIEKNG